MQPGRVAMHIWSCPLRFLSGLHDLHDEGVPFAPCLQRAFDGVVRCASPFQRCRASQLNVLRGRGTSSFWLFSRSASGSSREATASRRCVKSRLTVSSGDPLLRGVTTWRKYNTDVTYHEKQRTRWAFPVCLPCVMPIDLQKRNCGIFTCRVFTMFSCRPRAKDHSTRE